MRGAQFNDGIALTPSDTVVYQPPLSGFYVGGAGNVTVVTPSGNTITFTAPTVGEIVSIACSQVKATLTTATLLLGLKS